MRWIQVCGQLDVAKDIIEEWDQKHCINTWGNSRHHKGTISKHTQRVETSSDQDQTGHAPKG